MTRPILISAHLRSAWTLPRALTLAGCLLAGCAPAAPPERAPPPAAAPLALPVPSTRAERSGYTETSTHADVVHFLDSLRVVAQPFHLGRIGATVEGRDIPLVVASRPLVSSPAEARALGRPIVYLQGNIHGGEVEGKEALLAILRDLLTDPRPNVLDTLVILAVPVYNADGNDALGPQERNRSEQNGPASIGRRANAQGLDLNRDYVKAEAPETRASLRMFAEWDPDVFVDLHTTNGSYHGYGLTYAPSLTPAAGETAALTRDRLLPELRRRARERRDVETFDYGNFSLRYGADVTTDTMRDGWFSYDHRPRFGTNYQGLRDAVSLLGEAYSHDPFERRVGATRAWVEELLSLVAEEGPAILAATRDDDPVAGEPIPIRAELTRAPRILPVLSEDLARADSGVVTEPGVPAGLRRTGRFRTLRLPVHDRFDPTLVRTAPAAYLLPPDQAEAVRLLRLHGLRVEEISTPVRLRGEAFVVDSIGRSPRPFQGHQEVTLAGRWTAAERDAGPGWFLVPTAQPLARLAVYLLEPESDDGLTTWNVFDPWLEVGREHPVVRVR